MTLDELITSQKDFDSRHEGAFPWDSQITDNNLEILEFLIISFLGELGETSNLIKKIVRGDFTLEEKRSELSEEVADMFIYLLKLAYQLDINLEASYLQKMKKNQERFRYYEKGTSKKE